MKVYDRELRPYNKTRASVQYDPRVTADFQRPREEIPDTSALPNHRERRKYTEGDYAQAHGRRNLARGELNGWTAGVNLGTVDSDLLKRCCPERCPSYNLIKHLTRE